MARIKFDGICCRCGSKISKKKNSILKHVNDCRKTEAKEKRNDLILFIEGKHAKRYWLVIKISKDSSLKKLDGFIRDAWVECCGHLSEFFELHGRISMCHKIGDVFKDYEKIEYVYDFGSSTELVISCIGEIKSEDDGDIKLMLRNEMPEFACAKCKKTAALECPYCMDDDRYYCKKCCKTHK